MSAIYNKVLECFEKGVPISRGEIIDELFLEMTPQQISDALKELKRKGLITIAPTGEKTAVGVNVRWILK